MCVRQYKIWRCGHYDINVEPCGTARARGSNCKITTIGLPISLDHHCSLNCCRENLENKTAAIDAFLVKYKVPAGRSMQSRPRSEILKYTEEQNEELTENLARMREFLSDDIKRHARICVREFQRGRALTNERRKIMGWAPNPPISLQIPTPPRKRARNQEQTLIDQWEQSAAHEDEIIEYNRAQTDPNTSKLPAPRFTTPEDIQAEGSGRYNRIQEGSRLYQARMRELQQIRDDEEQAAMTRAAYPPNDPMFIGPRSTAPIAGMPQEPPRWRSASPEEVEHLILTEDEEIGFDRIFRALSEEWKMLFYERLMRRRVDLRRLSEHLEFVRPLGSDSRFFAVAYVVRRRNFETLLRGIEQVRERAAGEELVQGLPEAVTRYLPHIRDWLRYHITQLEHWFNQAPADMRTQVTALHASEATLAEAREERRAAQAASTRQSSPAPRCQSPASYDSDGTTRANPPRGRVSGRAADPTDPGQGRRSGSAPRTTPGGEYDSIRAENDDKRRRVDVERRIRRVRDESRGSSASGSGSNGPPRRKGPRYDGPPEDEYGPGGSKGKGKGRMV